MRQSGMNAVFAVALTAVAMPGCYQYEYEISNEPDGDRLNREITVRGSGPLEVEFEEEDVGAARDGEISRIAGLYDLSPPPANKENRATFRKKFGQKIPGDIGEGFYTRMETFMGSAFIHVERLSGNDQTETVRNLFENAKTTSSKIITWLDDQIPDGDRDWPRLKRFVAEDVRKDMERISLMYWTCRNAQYLFGDGSEEARAVIKKESLLRFLAYLVERDYIAAGDIPALNRSLSTPCDSDASLKPIIRRFIEGKLGISSPEILALFDDIGACPLGAIMSLEGWNEEDPEKRRLARHWRSHIDEWRGEDASEIDVFMVWTFLFDCRIFPFVDFKHVNIRLRTGTEPIFTNGTWDKPTGNVTWDIGMMEKRIPTTCSTAWVKPNRGFQVRHFGKVVLEGEKLFRYCLWRKGLTEEESKRWETALLQCTPEKNIVTALSSGDEGRIDINDERYRFAVTGIKLIREAEK